MPTVTGQVTNDSKRKTPSPTRHPHTLNRNLTSTNLQQARAPGCKQTKLRPTQEQRRNVHTPTWNTITRAEEGTQAGKFPISHITGAAVPGNNQTFPTAKQLLPRYLVTSRQQTRNWTTSTTPQPPTFMGVNMRMPYQDPRKLLIIRATSKDIAFHPGAHPTQQETPRCRTSGLNTKTSDGVVLTIARTIRTTHRRHP